MQGSAKQLIDDVVDDLTEESATRSARSGPRAGDDGLLAALRMVHPSLSLRPHPLDRPRAASQDALSRTQGGAEHTPPIETDGMRGQECVSVGRDG
jgi:hypothetical protein